MRIAFFSHSSKMYGAERSLLDLVLELKKYNIEPLVILPNHGPLIEELVKNEISYTVFRYYGWLGRKYKLAKGCYRFFVNIISTQWLSIRLRKKRVDLVYSNTLSIPIGAMVAKKIGVKHIWHIREFIHEDMGADFDFGASWAYDFVEKNTSFIIYNSHAVKNKFSHFLKYTENKVIYNGWLQGRPGDEILRKGLYPDEVVKLCIVGSIHEGKKQREIIDALFFLMQKFPRIKLDIVGDGDSAYIDKLKGICSTNKLSKRVSWIGYVENIRDVFKCVDISIVCSRNEAFGRVVVESMAEGCPVVAVRSGGIPEIIVHGENGMLYESGNQTDLVKQIATLIEDQDTYFRVVKNGLEDAYHRFNRGRLGKEVLDVLNCVQG